LELRLLCIAREFSRGPAPPVGSSRTIVDGEQHEDWQAVVPCAICRRDKLTIFGRETTTAEGEPVCWPCARYHAPSVAAEVIAQVAAHAEEEALSCADQTTRFLLDTIRERSGNHERARALERKIERVQELLRRSRQGSYSSPETWAPKGT
jgi:hypothetical protein